MTDEQRSVWRSLGRALAERDNDQQIVLAFCLLTVVVLTPFGIARLVDAQWLPASVNLTAVAMILLLGGYVWVRRRLGGVRYLMAALFLGTAIVAAYLFPVYQLYWAFPATVATFFILRPPVALAFNMVAAVVLLPAAMAIGSYAGIAAFYANLVTNNLLALLFATGMIRRASRFRTQAEHDPLTGAGNRRALDPAMQTALEACRNGGVPASLLVLDVDHFKSVNDRFGHEVGDRVLVELVRLIRATIRAGDYVFRYGGEEIVVLANGAAEEPAGALAEKLRVAIREVAFHTDVQVTVSIGVAGVERDDTAMSWFRRADIMLYTVKRAGRDGVRIAVDAKDGSFARPAQADTEVFAPASAWTPRM